MRATCDASLPWTELLCLSDFSTTHNNSRTFGEVLQFHCAELPSFLSGASTPPAIPAQREHHDPIYVGEHQGHAHPCRQRACYKNHSAQGLFMQPCNSRRAVRKQKTPLWIHTHPPISVSLWLLPTVTAVMTGDTKIERRMLLATERHCWQPDSLLFRPWLKTWRKRKERIRDPQKKLLFNLAWAAFPMSQREHPVHILGASVIMKWHGLHASLLTFFPV